MNEWSLTNISPRVYEMMPVLSIIIVLLLPMFLRHNAADVPKFGPEPKAVAEAVESLPFRIGQWAGADVPVPQAAVQLLRPNTMLSRQFTHLRTGMSVDVVIIHCVDARDMLGHYPPVCYPNSGWVFAEGANRRSDRHHRGQSLTLPMHEDAFPVTLYEFTRMRDWNRESHIRVISFFVLPDGTVTPSIDKVNQRTNRLGASIHGVAQFQIVSNRDVPLDEVLHGATELLEGMTPLMDALGVARNE